MVNVYSIRDRKGVWTHPFTDVSDEAAKRGFAYSVTSQNDIVAFAPADFDLYYLGQFDERKGLFTGIEVSPVFLMSGTDAFNLSVRSDHIEKSEC